MPQKRAGVRRMISQSIAFVYAPADGTSAETDPLDLSGTGRPQAHGRRCCRARKATLEKPEGIVLR